MNRDLLGDPACTGDLGPVIQFTFLYISLGPSTPNPVDRMNMG